MSGLLALLDDVAAIAKVAAGSIDDIAAGAARAGGKTAGVIIDDAAVTPKYVEGLAPARELPIIWRIARGSVFNKLVILLPLAIMLMSFAPWAITPLLMLGGCYLCFEGAEKVFHGLFPHADSHVEADLSVRDPAHLEEQKVRGAIKTDFILSAEIMTIALSAIEAPDVWIQAATLAVVALAVTAAIYGTVGVIVKMDDIGLYLAREAHGRIGRALGRGLVMFMPVLLDILSVVGTAAMLWVGGSILLHGFHEYQIDQPGHVIETLAEAVAQALPQVGAAARWAVTALLDGIFGLVLGLILIPLVTRVAAPLIGAVAGGRDKGDGGDR